MQLGNSNYGCTCRKDSMICTPEIMMLGQKNYSFLLTMLSDNMMMPVLFQFNTKYPIVGISWPLLTVGCSDKSRSDAF